jgi:hypothetical protein
MDQGPPPPYTPSDIYSNSSSRANSQPHPVLTTPTSNFDNASVPGQSRSEYDAASSTGDATIYTPPYTPDGDESNHLDYVADGFDNVSSPVSAIAASASAYFESRPVHHLSTDVLLVHTIIITEHPQPSDIPFPEPEKIWLERDVLPQDWETFVNYLIPHHTDASNHDVAERKLKDELIDERMHRLTLDQNDASRTDPRQVDAQLEPLRRHQTEQSVNHDVYAVVDAWNEGFFGKRNILIEAPAPQSEDGRRAMPGSWINHPAEETANGQGQAPPCTPRRGFGRGWLRADNTGFHMGRLSADNNGLRIGNLLVADGQGFKFGPLVANAQGLRIGNQPHPRHEHHPEHHPFHMPTNFRGRPSAREFSSRMSHRDRSHSTSSSSSSGASSIESAGSLPDYDHLNDTQLPIAKQAIKDWLNHPEQPITKQTVKQIKEEIKAAKSGNININEQDRESLRKEVRDLFREFKAIKKSQKKAWKAAKRERRSLRREAKRTRRAARREVKQADRDVRHAEREAKKAAKKEVRAGKMPEAAAFHTPPGAWPLENFQGPPHPPYFMPPHSLTHSMPQMGPPMDGQGWPYLEDSPATNAVKAAHLQAEGRRIEAEAKREEALRRAEETRQRALDQASAARSRAEESRREAEAKAAIAREKAQASAALAREKAEKHQQRAEANARIARQKAEANHMVADSNRMLADVNRMRMQAEQLQENARMKLLHVAEKLEEEAGKMKREGERLVAEAAQSAKDLTNAIREEESMPGIS